MLDAPGSAVIGDAGKFLEQVRHMRTPDFELGAHCFFACSHLFRFVSPGGLAVVQGLMTLRFRHGLSVSGVCDHNPLCNSLESTGVRVRSPARDEQLFLQLLCC